MKLFPEFPYDDYSVLVWFFLWFWSKVVIMCLVVGTIFLIWLAGYVTYHSYYDPQPDTVTLDVTNKWQCTKSIEYTSTCWVNRAQRVEPYLKTQCTAYERK